MEINNLSKKLLNQDEIDKFPNSFYSHAEAIFHLNEVGIEVKQTRVAEWLDVSRANVSQVTGRMQNSGLIKIQDELELTDKGMFLAKTISRRHRITERFLSEILNLPWENVYEESQKWENVLSACTEDAMLKLLKNPTTGPFGNPIPYSLYSKKEMHSLADAKINRLYSVEKITEDLKKDCKIIAFLQEHNIVPGTEIMVSDSSEYSITVKIQNKRHFGLDQYVADRIFVAS
jgi:DtxR family Mn-dependent transcriptional regulator